jgi:HEAT repeat protein
VRAALAEALDEAAASDAAALVPTLAKDPHATVRVLVAESLGKRHDDAYIATLCALARDPDAEVRRQSAQSLAQFPTPASRDTLVALLGDDRTLVRREAEESLVVLHAKSPVDVAVSQRLDDPQPHARYHAFRILGRLNSRQFAQAIGTQLPSERLPINIAAAVFALGQFEAREAAAPIAALASHSDAGIRRAVATALGRLRVPATYETIRTLAFDNAVEVRQAAIISMGWIADGHAFNATLLKVLATVQESRMTSANHGAAAWSAARCRPLSPAIAKRLVVQGTEAIIPGPMGEMLFEPDYVLASCDFALAQMARTNPDLLPQFTAIQAIHSRAVDPNTPTGNNLLRPSAEVREYARQAKAYLAGTTIPPLPRPTTPKVYDYAEYRPREP